MAIDITLEASPESAQRYTVWAYGVSNRVQDAGNDVYYAGRDSAAGWPDAPGESFRRTAKSLSRDSDTVATSFSDLAAATEEYADDIRAVRKQLDAAYDHAVKAGLPETRLVEIKDPGPRPDKPRPKREYAGDGASLGSNDDQWHAWNRWHDKAKAYAECIAMVTAARVLEEQAGSAALKAVRKVVDGAPITAADTLIGLAAASITGQRTLIASKISLQQTAARHMADYKRLSEQAGKGTLAAKTWIAGALNETKASIATRKAANAKLGNWLTKLPPGVQTFLVAEFGSESATKRMPFLRRAPMWVKRLPVVGTLVAGYAIGDEIAGGGNPTKAVASGGGGLVAGALAGGAVGGIPGVLVGAIVGTGTTAGIDTVLDTIWPEEEPEILAPGPSESIAGLDGRQSPDREPA